MPALATSAQELHSFEKRALCRDQYGNVYRCYGGIGTGGRAGIGIAIAVFVIFLILLLSLCARRRRRAQGYVFRPNTTTASGPGFVPGAQSNPYAAGAPPQGQAYGNQGYPQQGFGGPGGYGQGTPNGGGFSYPPPADGYKAPEGPPPGTQQYAPPSAPPPSYQPPGANKEV